MELDYRSNHKPKLGLTCEVNLKEDLFVDNCNIFEIFDEVENFDLHALSEEIRSDKSVKNKEFVDLMKEEENSDLICEEKNYC